MANATRMREELRALMKGIDIAMFTTMGEGGFPVTRPLSTQEAEFDGRLLWFFVRRNSAKVAEIQRYPRVNVAYVSKEKNVYLSVTGTADIVDDRAKIDELWNDALKAFFPRGAGDPNLVLVRVAVHTVEYWSGPSTAIGKAVAFVVARVTKNDDAMGETHLLRFGRNGGVTARKITTERPARPQRAARKPAAKRSAASKSAAGKSPAKKSSARKAPARTSATTKSASKKSASKSSATKKTSAARR
jgi:general stress protein 26